jgi:predicted metalloendopeptidase
VDLTRVPAGEDRPGGNFYHFACSRQSRLAGVSAFQIAEDRASRKLVELTAMMSSDSQAAASVSAGSAFHRLLRQSPPAVAAEWLRCQLAAIDQIDSFESMVAWLCRPDALVRGPLRFVFGASAHRPPRRAITLQCFADPLHPTLTNASGTTEDDDECRARALIAGVAAVAENASAGDPFSATLIAPAALDTITPAYPWRAAVKSAGLQSVPAIRVCAPDLIRTVAEHAAREPLSGWKAFARVHVRARVEALCRASASPVLAARTAAGAFPATFRDAWRQVDGWHDDEEAVTRLYASVRDAFISRLNENRQLPIEQRRRAVEKLAALTLIVADGVPGIPEFAVDSSLPPPSVLAAARAAQWCAGVAALGRPLRLQEFLPPIFSATAKYEPDFNVVIVSPALVREPFYDRHNPALTYGALGGVIGHEIAHALLDAFGISADRASLPMVSWWRHLNGNVEDNDSRAVEMFCDRIGLAMAVDAFTSAQSIAKRHDVEAWQRLFQAWARMWAGAREHHAHASGEIRTNEVVRHLDEWYAAFNIDETEPMFVAPSQRIRLL